MLVLYHDAFFCILNAALAEVLFRYMASFYYFSVFYVFYFLCFIYLHVLTTLCLHIKKTFYLFSLMLDNGLL